MAEEKVNFVWNSYAMHYKQTLIEMMVLDKYTDVTLVCDDLVQVKSHRAILGSCSKMFRNIFELAGNGSNMFLYLKGTKSNDLKSILQFIYEGETSVAHEHLTEFLKIAEDLDISDINKDNEAAKNVIKNNYNNQVMSYVWKDDCKNELDEENIKESTLIVKKSEFLEKEDLDYQECNECDEVLENKTALLNHLEIVHPIKIERIKKSLMKSKKKYYCQECNANFTKKCSLKVHQESIHLNITYSCDQCVYTAKTKTHLRGHIQKNHMGKLFLCTLCEYGVRNQSALKHHIDSIHKGIKFYCNVCDYEGTSKKYLKAHYGRYHADLTLTNDFNTL